MSESAPSSMGRRCKRYPYRDELLTLVELSELSGVPVKTLRSRLSSGWSVEEAVDTKTIGQETWLARNKIKVAMKADAEKGEECSPRLMAAHKIAAEIICSSIGEFDFECLEPGSLYAFRSDILAYRIRFSSTADACTATLTAFYPEKGIWSTLNRKYAVIGSKIKEMN